MTCRRLAEYLRENILDENAGRFFEEASLKAIHRTLQAPLTVTDIQLLFSELPAILPKNYPVVNEIRKLCLNIIPQLMNVFRMSGHWQEFNKTYYLSEMLKTFDNCEYK